MAEIVRKTLAEKVRDAAAFLVAHARIFGPCDEADGARIGGYHLVRGEDGQLYGVAEPKGKKR